MLNVLVARVPLDRFGRAALVEHQIVEGRPHSSCCVQFPESWITYPVGSRGCAPLDPMAALAYDISYAMSHGMSEVSYA